MSNGMVFHYDVDGNDFTLAGEISSKVKKRLKQLGLPPEVIRKVSIAMYEAEINMVIHANGGAIDVEVTPQAVHITFADQGPGIPDLEKAMQEGFSTASNEVRELGFGAGMGLPNIKKNSDNMTIDTKVGEGTTIKLVINIA
ncbi:MAG: ATP-binding protein [Clostridia bacterium]|nr:ATP-binding protein [Clostridia bacterium]